MLGLDWDLSVMVYTPVDAERIARGPDGRRIGVFVLHGGSDDYKSMVDICRTFVKKFGCKVLAMAFPGRLNLDNPARNWQNDTTRPDGTVCTPVWKAGEQITPGQYEEVRDTTMHNRYGTRTVARAKPGTTFWNRMAARPAAFEAGMKDAMHRLYPAAGYSIYVTGHSTGGPMVFMICQRVANIAGVIAV